MQLTKAHTEFKCAQVLRDRATNCDDQVRCRWDGANGGRPVEAVTFSPSDSPVLVVLKVVCGWAGQCKKG